MKKREAKCTETACDIRIRPVCCVKWNKLSKPAQIRQVDSPFWAQAQRWDTEDVGCKTLSLGHWLFKTRGCGQIDETHD